MPYLKTLDQRHGIRITGSAVTVGSAPDSHIPIRAPFVVAAKQFTLVESGGRYMIQNTDEAGRTHVNGQPVEDIWLKDGDVIHAGDLALLYLDEKPGAEDPVLMESRPSTPFQTNRPTSRELRAAGETPEETQDTNYDAIAVSTLSKDETSPIMLEPETPEAEAARRKRAVAASATNTLASPWVMAILTALAYAWWENGSDIAKQVSHWMAPETAITELVMPKEASKALDEHFEAVRHVATLPPDSFASIALADFMLKTSNAWTKERVEKQIVRALAPLVTKATDVERLTLLDAAQPSSRMVVVTLTERKTLNEVLKDLSAGHPQAITLEGLNAVHLSAPDGGTPRHIVEVTPGNFIVTDVAEEKLNAHLATASRVKRLTGIAAMAHAWKWDYISSVRPHVLASTGADTGYDTLTAAPVAMLNFEAIPVAAVVLPVGERVRDELFEQWSGDADNMVTKLMALNTLVDTQIAVGKDTLQFRAHHSGSTLLDEIWRRQFNDFDLKFRPLALDF
jgi:hypothetical protein